MPRRLVGPFFSYTLYAVPLPSPLRRLIGNTAYWRRHYRLTGYEKEAAGDRVVSVGRQRWTFPEPKACTVDIPVGTDGYGLALNVEYKGGWYRSLALTRPNGPPIELGYVDAESVPDVLRWSEVELICRAVALSDADFPHPGPLLALLYDFAPICVDDELSTIVPTVVCAMRAVADFSNDDIEELLGQADARVGRFFWRRLDGDRWVITQEEGMDLWRPLYSFRSPQSEFPFDDWARLLQSAKNVVLAIKGLGGTVAQSIAEAADVRLGANLAIQLVADGRPDLAAGLGQPAQPARVAWLAESMADRPSGSLVKSVLRATNPTLPGYHPLALTVFLDDAARPVLPATRALLKGGAQRALVDLGAGRARLEPEDSPDFIEREPSEPETTHQRVLLEHTDDGLATCLDWVKQCLWWTRAPGSCTLVDAEQRSLPLDLEVDPGRVEPLILDLAILAPVAMTAHGQPQVGFRRLPLQTEGQAAIREGLTDGSPSPRGKEWTRLVFSDGGRMDVCLRGLRAERGETGMTLVIDSLSAQVASQIWRFGQAHRWTLLPMRFVLSEAAARVTNRRGIAFEKIATQEQLFEHLDAGPYHWWKGSEP